MYPFPAPSIPLTAEGIRAHEDRLVAVRNACIARPQVREVQEWAEPGAPRAVRNGPGAEGARDDARIAKRVRHALGGFSGELDVGVQEEQDVAGGGGRAGVHLRGAAASSDEDARARRLDSLDRPVAAAAVDDDDLVQPVERGEALELTPDARLLVEHGDDDGVAR